MASTAQPSVSVLMPVRNAAVYLDACLESLAVQSLENFEIVAVDDGSRDETPAILERWQRCEPRLRVVTAPATGLVPSLNLGLERCQAPLIARMDGDDLCHPDRLRLQAELLGRQPELTLAGCLVEHFSDAALGQGLRIYDRWLNSLITHQDILKERFIESPLPHPAVMFRRQAILEIGGYLDRGWPEDYDLWLRLARSGARFAKVPQVLHSWRDRSDRLSRTDSRYSVERFLECKAEHLMLGPLLSCRRLLVWGAGQTGRRLTKHLLRRQAPLEAFIDIDPAKWHRTVRGVPVLPPAELERFAPSRGRGLSLLAAVSSRGARAKIRTVLDRSGWRETVDYWCVA